MRWLPLLLLLLTARTWALSSELGFVCDPQDTEVWLQQAGSTPILLGLANRPVLLRRASLTGPVTLTFRRPGWKQASLTVQPDELKYDHYPPRGSFILVPGSDLVSRARQAMYAMQGCLPWLSIPIVLSVLMGLGKRALDGRRGPRGLGVGYQTVT